MREDKASFIIFVFIDKKFGDIVDLATYVRMIAIHDSTASHTTIVHQIPLNLSLQHNTYHSPIACSNKT